MQPPFSEARDVGLPPLESLANINCFKCDVAMVAEPPGKVVVPVEEESGVMDPSRLLGNVRRGLREHGTGTEKPAEQYEKDAARTQRHGAYLV